MRWRDLWIQPDVVSPAPTVRRARQLVGYREPRPDIYAERGSVQPDRGLTGLARVEIHYDEDRIAARGAGLRRTHSLRKAQNLRPVRKMETQVTQLGQCGM